MMIFVVMVTSIMRLALFGFLDKTTELYIYCGNQTTHTMGAVGQSPALYCPIHPHFSPLVFIQSTPCRSLSFLL